MHDATERYHFTLATGGESTQKEQTFDHKARLGSREFHTKFARLGRATIQNKGPRNRI